MDWKEILPELRQYVTEFGIHIISAAAILIIGIWVSKSVTKLLKKILNKKNVDITLVEFSSSALKFALYLFVIIAAVSRLGIETTSLIAALGAAGLAIGLALQGSLSNVAAGIMLIIFRQVKVGQFIESGDVKGTVEKVGIFNTTLITIENKVIFIPNSKLINDNIINYSEKENRMIDLVVGISYKDDIDKAKSTLQSIIDNDADILKQPAAIIAVGELTDNSVRIYVRPWVVNKKAVEVRFRLIEQIKKKFDEENISIPYPQRDVYIHQSK
ncbi:MAG: mechanosensitive ion channel [Ignavibacterium sp.]|jgi:small conductance mechanosensitive channel|nr:mechanosensitive ion channel [Ignavibacterium sp.]